MRKPLVDTGFADSSRPSRDHDLGIGRKHMVAAAAVRLYNDGNRRININTMCPVFGVISAVCSIELLRSPSQTRRYIIQNGANGRVKRKTDEKLRFAYTLSVRREQHALYHVERSVLDNRGFGGRVVSEGSGEYNDISRTAKY